MPIQNPIAVYDATDLQAVLDAKLDDSQAGAAGLAVLGASDVAGAREAIGLPTAGIQLQPTRRAETSTAVSHTTSWATVVSVSITPLRTDSIIEIFAQVPLLFAVGPAAWLYGGLRLVQGATVVFDPNPSDVNGPYGLSAYDEGYIMPSIRGRHAPGVTTPVIYSVEARIYSNSGGRSMESCPIGSIQNGKAIIEAKEIAA